MPWLNRHACLAGVILALAGPATAGAPLPVRLSEADPRWRLAESPKEVGPDLTLAAAEADTDFYFAASNGT